MTPHATNQLPTHEVIPAALAEYCESVRQRRMRPLLAVAGCPSVFEAVIKEHVAAHKEKSSGTLKQQIKDIITRTVKETGNKVHAAKRLGISRMTVQAYTKGITNLLLLGALLAFGSTAFAQPIIPIQRLAAAPAPANIEGSGSVTLTWSQSASARTNTVIYCVAWGTNANALSQSTCTGTTTNLTLKNLRECVTYYFSLTASFTNSQAISETRTNVFIQPQLRSQIHSWVHGMTLIGGRTNIIQASSDLSDWENVLTNTTGGYVTFWRTNRTQEYYRVKP